MNTEDNNDFYDDELSRSLISNDFEGDTPQQKEKKQKASRDLSDHPSDRCHSRRNRLVYDAAP